ncbi:zf-PARP-domain-containing protein [Rickenella mellea]|uniref:Zf-PARP-domain-containing protein n=1 Tax=Rickenella mellea TaxID=50990 RepID=A0A4Y7Q3S4_9AGAM|nr:zf-PARP-domain-containing protein [Rickenella mellea]
MSGDEAGPKKSGYRLDYAARSTKCKGPKPCTGTAMPKGTLRVGSVVDIAGRTSFIWRHWGCTTPKILTTMKSKFNQASDLDGFDELKPEDQAKIQKAWDEGHVADEDIPETARKPAAEGGDEDGGEKPKRKRAPAKKKAKKDEDEEGDEEEAEEKPKKKAAPRKKAKVRRSMSALFQTFSYETRILRKLLTMKARMTKKSQRRLPGNRWPKRWKLPVEMRRSLRNALLLLGKLPRRRKLKRRMTKILPRISPQSLIK